MWQYGKATAIWQIGSVMVVVVGGVAETSARKSGRDARGCRWPLIGRARCHMLRLRMATRGQCTTVWYASERYRRLGFL